MAGQTSTTAPDRTLELDGAAFRATVLLSDHNQRVQVLSYQGPEFSALVGELRRIAAEQGVGKVFMKADPLHRPALEAAGMEAEASITGFFDGEDAGVMSLFLVEGRRDRPHRDEEQEILDAVRRRKPTTTPAELPEGYSTRVADERDFGDLAGLYGEVFASYPYPITDAEYLRRTAASHVVYRVIRDASGQMVAAASAETNRPRRNAEMTDFATLPSQRGLGMARLLLEALEGDMRREGVPHLYTIARARSAGMNRVFANCGYEWTGTLVNNCHISGDFEDMHVWCKQTKGAR
jgi:putative beta-lysine N-acetyltransferase